MVYVFMANGFEELEALSAVDLLRRAGIPVTTVGVGGNMPTGSHGVSMRTDIEENEFEMAGTCEAVVLPGGIPGANNLEASRVVQEAIDTAYKSGAIVAAICAAPFILAHKGILKGKQATIYPSMHDELGGSYVDKRVVEDGNIITACGPGAAISFALKLIERLRGRELAERVAADAVIE